MVIIEAVDNHSCGYMVVGSLVTTWHGMTATVAACNCDRAAVVIAQLRGCRASIASSEAQLLVGQG
jgi:hypothetical protein